MICFSSDQCFCSGGWHTCLIIGVYGVRVSPSKSVRLLCSYTRWTQRSYTGSKVSQPVKYIHIHIYTPKIKRGNMTNQNSNIITQGIQGQSEEIHRSGIYSTKERMRQTGSIPNYIVEQKRENQREMKESKEEE